VYSKPKTILRPSQASVAGRREAAQLATNEPQRAFDIAGLIPDGWYRCQAMAEIALLAPEPLSEKAFVKALEAAAAGADDYQRTAVLAWVIEAALKRRRPDIAEMALKRALALAPSVEPMNSRAYAFRSLWKVTGALGDGTMRNSVLVCIQAHVHPDRSWRAKRLYRDIAANIAWNRPDQASAFIRNMPLGRARAFVERHRSAGERKQARWS
jgi:hypothetical protein